MDWQPEFELPIKHVIPNDFQTAMSAIDAGIPVMEVSERSPLTVALRGVAAQFMEGAKTEQGAAKGGMFGKLTKLFNKN